MTIRPWKFFTIRGQKEKEKEKEKQQQEDFYPNKRKIQIGKKKLTYCFHKRIFTNFKTLTNVELSMFVSVFVCKNVSSSQTFQISCMEFI
ncbi:hypothetical protein QFZ31_000345 [Neobacillus niacini]|uniref:hypothetical protein n=1 Tax=Neobacillus driksii TaxID=3035913 RepID=UPI00278A465E|nr:hypothetical protein [Neobacillus niacini]MDQ0970467.1 hypothetical protein [Neobacillus niacini]